MSFDAISAICTICARCEAESAALRTADCFDTNKRTEKHNKRYCADVSPSKVIVVIIKNIDPADSPRDDKGDQGECRDIFQDRSHNQASKYRKTKDSQLCAGNQGTPRSSRVKKKPTKQVKRTESTAIILNIFTDMAVKDRWQSNRTIRSAAKQAATS